MSQHEPDPWALALLAELDAALTDSASPDAASASADDDPGLGPAGLLVIVLAILWFVPSFFLAAPAPGSGGEDIPLGALSAAAVAAGEPWRIVTMIVEHVGPYHLLCNAGVIWIFSAELEERFGSVTIAVLMFAATVGASGAAMLSGPERVYVGASGLACGLVGASLATAPKPQESAALGIAIWTGLWSFLPYVSVAAHAGGFATGLVLGALLRLSPIVYWLVAPVVAIGLTRETLLLAASLT